MKLGTLKHAIDHKPVADDFAIIEADRPTCPENGILVRVVHLSLDPYVGSRLRGRHMGEPAPEPMKRAIPGAIVGQVIESEAAGFAEGDWVHAMEGGWQEYVALSASEARKIDPSVAPLAAHAGVLGMPGLTAWAGITQLAKVGAGDTVLIDAAAGPVGGTVGQIARIKGADRVVGIAGGPEKCALVTGAYGFDACIDYKTDGWRERLADALPDGLSVFFENVSADMAMLALTHARLYARGVLCGLVDAYHTDTQSQHPLNAGLIIGKRAQLSGLVVYDFYPRWDEYIAEAAPWIASGQLKFAEDRAGGLEQAPALFERLMNGKNKGKAVVTVAPEQV
ncbi:MAG: NADP-dependent oxidoreductase [Henriciella sp.]|nr:NADP-dependent oxidoreductase [Henriciella sp.]